MTSVTPPLYLCLIHTFLILLFPFYHLLLDMICSDLFICLDQKVNIIHVLSVFCQISNSSQLCQLVRSRRLRLLHFPRNGRRVHELRQGKTKENHNHIPRPYIVNFQFLTWCTIDQRRRCTRESLAYANRIVAVRTSFDTVGRRFSNRVSTVPYRATIPSTSTKFVSFPPFFFLNHDFFKIKII